MKPKYYFIFSITHLTTIYISIYTIYITIVNNIMEFPLFDTRELPIEKEITSDIPPLNQTQPPLTSIENVIEKIIPKQSEENKFSKIRQALGETAKSLSTEQIETIASEFQFLIDTWLDEYEQDLFKGLTLKEVLSEKKL